MKQSIIILAAMVLLSAAELYAGDEMANRSGWQETNEMVAGRLAIQDHGKQHGTRVLSVIVELKNRSGHALDMEFDPQDLRTEVFSSDGSRVEEGSAQRSGPVPISHRMTISAGAYAGLPTHRGGVGLPVGRTMLAAGWQMWTLPPGKYTMKGTATITAGFGSAALDPLLPHRGFRAKENDFPPVGETKSISVELRAVSFQVNPEDKATTATPAPETSAESTTEVKEGIYRPSDEGSTTLTLWDGQTVRAQWQSGLSHRTAKLRSVNNDNTVYQLDIEFPFSEQGQRNRYLVTRGVAVSVTYSSKVDQNSDTDVWHHWYNQLQIDSTQTEAMQALVAGLKATQMDRTHSGHVLRTHWKPTARVFRVGEPVVLQMTLTNVGQQPVSFYDGGMQRGPRNNQFDFICRAGDRGPALPDVGDPMNFGGMAQKITLQPEESLTKEIDITKWFPFKDKGTYSITGLFHLELHPVDSDNWRVLWEDIAVGQCQIKIEPATAGPAKTTPDN